MLSFVMVAMMNKKFVWCDISAGQRPHDPPHMSIIVIASTIRRPDSPITTVPSHITPGTDVWSCFYFWHTCILFLFHITNTRLATTRTPNRSVVAVIVTVTTSSSQWTLEFRIVVGSTFCVVEFLKGKSSSFLIMTTIVQVSEILVLKV